MSSIFRSLFARRAGQPRRTPPARRPSLEALEDRAVPAITVPTPGSPGPVTVTGTAGPDQFAIRLSPTATTPTLQISDDGAGISPSKRCAAFSRWCPGPESNRHGRSRPADFKSAASTSFATWAGCLAHCKARTPVVRSACRVLASPSQRLWQLCIAATNKHPA